MAGTSDRCNEKEKRVSSTIRREGERATKRQRKLTSGVKVTRDERVELGQSVRDIEHLLVERHGLLGNLESVRDLVDDVGRRVDSKRDGLSSQGRDVAVLFVFEGSGGEGEEV